MKTSESIKHICVALLAAQRKISFAAKDSTNPHFKSKYADLPTVIDAIKPALNEAGIVFMQSASPCPTGTLALTTRLIHESGEWIEDTATLPLQKNDPQGYGSAMSYARRYSLASIIGLYQDDDDGHAASQPVKEKPASAKPVSVDTFEKMDSETQEYLRNVAMVVISMLAKNEAVEAYEYMESENLDADLKVGLWSLLDSKQRASIKQISTTKKAA